MENNYNWRLAIVTDALGKPKLRMLGKDETKAACSFEPMIWFAKPRETEADE
jgi:hypothetical protein